MKVENIRSSRGNKVANQFIITDDNGTQVFQSYETTIAKKQWLATGLRLLEVFLDREAWNYSRTTSKYRNIFLGETTKETQKKIDSGEYILADLN